MAGRALLAEDCWEQRYALTFALGFLHTTLDQSDRADEAGLEYLRRAGVNWSPHPPKDHVWQEYERIWRQLGNRLGACGAYVHLAGLWHRVSAITSPRSASADAASIGMKGGKPPVRTSLTLSELRPTCAYKLALLG
jgi:hypothetical protein